MNPALRLLLMSPQFSPAQLFASGAQGAWYDSSDLSSMFQDSAGTTPVTAAGQPVGLRLDKRYGLNRGAELLPTGDFSAATGWTLQSGFAISGGKLNLTAAADGAFASYPAGLVAGKLYEFIFTIDSLSAGGIQFTGEGASTGSSGIYTTAQSNRVVIKPVSNGAVYIFAKNAPTTAVIDILSVREIPGNHASQSTTTSRPTLQQDSAGRYYLSYDGVDDSMATSAIDFTGTDKMSVFAGVYKASDAAIGMVAELSADANSNAGAFFLTAPLATGASGDFAFKVRGSTVGGQAASGAVLAPVSRVLTATADIAADSVVLRLNGAQVGTSAADQGTGNFGNYPLYLGRRNNASLPFNGRDYGSIIVGRALTPTEIVRTERWLAAKAGITL